MELFVKGEVVVVPFPFSNLSDSKKRPAVVVADLPGDDLILCQVTSKPYDNTYSIPLDHTDFADGGLTNISFVRPDKLFTGDSQIIIRSAGHLRPSTMNKITETIVRIFQA